MSDYDWGDPYDPDLTVQEALDAGLIIWVDGKRIGDNYGEPCFAESFFDPRSNPEATKTTKCTRKKGHSGPHAVMVRWDQTYVERRAYVKAAAERQKASMMAAEKAAASMRKSVEEMSSSMAATAKALDNLGSRVYGGIDGRSTKDKYRDHNVGKVKGRQR